MNSIEDFKNYLSEKEYAKATAQKYIHDVNELMGWLAKNKKSLSKDSLLEYKEVVIKLYKLRSVNSIISSLNAYFSFIKRYDLKLKTLKVQRKIFSDNNKELTKREYERLLDSAKKKSEKLYYLIQTICSVGIRVSELKYITTDAIKNGYAIIDNKGKYRKILLPKTLCKMLYAYAKKNNIKGGSIFITKGKKALDRSNIWKMLKGLCKDANVNKEKVFPHNLRHLFARTFYNMQKDIVKLADILGHSNIETTRIYTIETGKAHLRKIEKMGLLRC